MKRENTLYYHTDHLGSSGYVTDKKGEFYEHTEYTSSGESWVNEKVTGNADLPFKYTGKEQDAETGLYYYGARYRDAKTGVWLSVDPYLEKYFPSGNEDNDSNLPAGGIFNSINMNLYHYAGNNPIVLTDPDGNYTLESNNDGTSNYRAEFFSGWGRKFSRWWRINMPFGSKVYSNYLNSNNYIDTNKSILPISSKIARNLGKLKQLEYTGTNAGKVVATFGKKAGYVGYALLIADYIMNDGVVLSKEEIAIQAAGIFENKDADFISEYADGIKNTLTDYFDAGEMEVTGFETEKGTSFFVEDSLGYLDYIKSDINEKYKQWKSNKDIKE